MGRPRQPNRFFNERAWKIIHMIADGMSEKEIANILGIKVGVVKFTLMPINRLHNLWPHSSKRRKLIMCERLSGCLRS